MAQWDIGGWQPESWQPDGWQPGEPGGPGAVPGVGGVSSPELAGTPDVHFEQRDENLKEVEEEEKDRVLREFVNRLRQSKEHGQEWRAEAIELYDMLAGHQWEDTDLSLLKERYKGSYPAVTFNLAGKYMDVVNGLQINNRQQIRYFPRELGDAGVNELLTGAVDWNRDQCEAEDEETDAFSDAFWVGMAWIEHFLDEQRDDTPIISQERRDPLEMYWDPMARKRNLEDSRYVIRLKPMLPEEYEEFFGEDAPGELAGVRAAFGTDDDSPQVMLEPHDYGDSKSLGQRPKPIWVADYQWYEIEKKFTVQAMFPEGPQTQVFSRDEWAETRVKLQEALVPYQSEPKPERVYKRAWIVANEIKGDILALPGKQFLYLAITGKRDRNKNLWYGMGRTIRDPQMWVNKFFSSILYALSTNAKGGLLVEEGVFADQRKAEQDWGDPSSMTFVADGAIANQRIMPKPQAPYPQGLDRLMTFSLEALPMTSGLNPEIMGLAGREQPGVLEAQRKQSAMAIIAWVFDSMRRYYKQSGKLMAVLVREYMPEGTLIRISGKDGEQYVPLLKDSMTQTFDVVVDESPTSVNMRERTWLILKEMIPMALSAGIKIPPEVLDYAPVPEDLMQKWKRTLEPKPEEQQAAQQAQQMQQADLQAETSKKQAQAAQAASAAQLNQAKAQEIGQSTPVEAALTHMKAMKTAAETGKIQAGE